MNLKSHLDYNPYSLVIQIPIFVRVVPHRYSHLVAHLGLGQNQISLCLTIEPRYVPMGLSSSSHVKLRCFWRYGSFHNWGSPKTDGASWKIPLKWMIWGYPYSREPSYVPFSSTPFSRDVIRSSTSGHFCHGDQVRRLAVIGASHSC